MYSSPASYAPQLPATAVAGALVSRMGFNTLLPLLIISTIYGFFTYLNLRIVGIDLRGLELAIFEVDLTQTGCEGVLEFSKALSRGDVCPNRVQPLMNPRKGKFGKNKTPVKTYELLPKK